MAGSQGRQQDALMYLEKALACSDGDPACHNNLAVVLKDLGRLGEAERHARQALAADSGRAVAYATLGEVLWCLNRQQEALDVFRQCLEREPRYVPAHINLGNALVSLGWLDEAIGHYRAALEIDPGFAPSYYAFVVNAAQQPSAEELVRMRALFDDRGTDPENRVLLGYSLARALDRDRHDDDAFDYARQANDLKKQRYRQRGITFSPQEHTRFVDAILETFTAEFFGSRSGWGVQSDLPVFVVGMPRSGTTLVEQILASHPDVAGAGELPDIENMASALPTIMGAGNRSPACVADLDAGLMARLADEYLGRLAAGRGSASRVVDKTTINFLHLGLIALVLPNARVIHCRRDPRDVCVSCYFQNFGPPGMVFACDLEHLGAFYKQYALLMAHWRRVLPLAILDVPYEDLVADQEGFTRRLIEFCGLPWDSRCLEFHRNPRDIRTSSAVQVRQPIYTTSLARWKRYEGHLEPFLRHLSTGDE